MSGDPDGLRRVLQAERIDCMPRKSPPQEPQVPVSPEGVWWHRRSRLHPDDLVAADAGLQAAIRAHLPELEALLEEATRQYEDGVYRFWHWSFKVYRLQDVSARIASALRALSSDGMLMVCRYGRELEEPPKTLPSGWAAVLELYGFR